MNTTLPLRSLLPLLAAVALAVAATTTTTGCDSLLDTEPSQSISEERALSSPQNVEAALSGAYDALSNADLYGGQIFMNADLMADNGEVFWDGTYEQPAQFWNKNLFVNNAFVADEWNEAYETINIANNVLSALDQFEDEERRTRVEGEARFLRGLMYFELVRLFAKPYDAVDPSAALGVPIVLEPTRSISDEDNVERASMAVVYEQVTADLEAAREQLGSNANKYVADTYVASAVLSRVYLARDEYEAAARAADRVIASGDFSLMETFAGAFNNESAVAEYVFAVPITTQDGVNELNTFYGSGSQSDPNGGRGDISITDEHVALYGDGDARGNFFYIDESDGDARRTGKWKGDESTGADIPVIRLAEMYLTRAEGNFRAGTEIGAAPIADINRIRGRAGANPLDASNLTAERIFEERKLELMFEGHLLHDLQRTERSVGSIPYDANALLYPIPQREMDANPSLTQNPGYGS